MQLLFASSNEHKISELKAILPNGFELISLRDIHFEGEIPETADTIEGNAVLKAEFLADQLNIPCFADDTGLVIPSLNGEPGVYSARYAGPNRDSNDNMDLVLERLKNKPDRSAYFSTIIALHIAGKTHVFEGRVDGTIEFQKKGDSGFGYDPIFKPTGNTLTFAEMSSDEKNRLSHRVKAVVKMIEFLNRFEF